MRRLVQQLRERLHRARDATRLRDWSADAPLNIEIYALPIDPDHLALAMDAVETFHPGSCITVHADAPDRAPPSRPAPPPDRLILLHPWPWIDDAKRRQLAPVRGAWRRAARRFPDARPWILFRNMELWDGSLRAAIRRRLIDAFLRPLAALADRLDDARLRRLVLPHLAATEHWNAADPCAHPRRVRVFETPRAIDFCPDCGMGLTPPETVAPAAAHPHTYGPGYARSYCYTGDREFRRYVAESVERVNTYLSMLKFPDPNPPASAPPLALDYGCGNGRLSPLWLQRGWRYLGVDFSAANIDFARRLVAKLHPDADARFLVGSLDDPELDRAAPFDAIVLSHVLEHVPDPPQFLARLRTLARPGAWLYIEVPDAARYTWNLRHRGYANTEHLWDFTPPTLATLTRQTGWTDIRTHLDPNADRYPFIALLALKQAHFPNVDNLGRRPSIPAWSWD
jgi:SAM-dependent methyltransferase